MDAIELGRQAAAKLHAELMEAQVSPWALLDLAKAQAKRQDLDIELATKGASSLNGCRASLVPGSKLIVIEREGSDFDRAFLIAHELGHAYLGDDVAEEEKLYDIDPSRAAEATPIGLDRVVDYGQHQRREIQMDLFARELLMPRPWVRSLHMDSGLTASQIAERLGAPFDVVAQQLLDALLLPEMPPQAEEDQPERPLNDLQREASRHEGTPFLLEAGPGTGKTRALVGRVEYLLAKGADPRRILVLTFSNKAAGELSTRIARFDPQAAAAMWIGTFHAFGLDLVRRFHQEMKLPKDPRLLDRTEAVELIENEFPRLKLAHYRNVVDPTELISTILSAISRAKDEVVGAQVYLDLASNMRAAAQSDAEVEAADKALEVAKVYEVYEQIKRDRQCVDFGDLVSLPVLLMEDNEAVRTLLQATYDHILVDEYQDVNRSSVRLLTSLCGGQALLWAVGDAKQSIYRFRGASSYNIANFGILDFPGGQRGQLVENYRSVPEALAPSIHFAKFMGVGAGAGALVAMRAASGQRPELRQLPTGDDEIVAVADAIAQMHTQGHAYRDQAVLFTGNAKLAKYGKALETLGIPVLFLGNLFERDEVKDVLAFISLLVDRRAMGLLRTACMPEFPMPLADVATVISYAREHHLEGGQWRGAVGAIGGLTGTGRASLAKLAEVLEGFEGDSPPWDVVASVLLDRTRIAAGLAQSEAIRDRARGIGLWQLMNFLRGQPKGKGLPISRVLDRIRRLVRLGDDRDLRQLPACAQHLDAVRLMTIHGAKGLEFGVVHVPGMNVSTLPRAAQPLTCPPPVGMVEGAQADAVAEHKEGHAREQECLFYVALSRARDRLFLYAASVNAGGAKRGLSSFIAHISGVIETRAMNPSKPLPADAADASVQLVIDTGITVKGSEVGIFESCPRRFFYTYILQIGGKRTPTPFTHMHEAVRSACAAGIAAGDVSDTHLHQKIEDSFAASGLAGHGYVDEYRDMARGLVQFFAQSRADHTPEVPAPLTLVIGEEKIILSPEDVLIAPNGERVFRRVRTGHAREADKKDIGNLALLFAAQEGAGKARVELVYLADLAVVEVSPNAKQAAAGRTKVAETLAKVRAGDFSADPSQYTCPNCPAFFVCGPTPPGPLPKAF